VPTTTITTARAARQGIFRQGEDRATTLSRTESGEKKEENGELCHYEKKMICMMHDDEGVKKNASTPPQE